MEDPDVVSSIVLGLFLIGIIGAVWAFLIKSKKDRGELEAKKQENTIQKGELVHGSK